MGDRWRGERKCGFSKRGGGVFRREKEAGLRCGGERTKERGRGDKVKVKTREGECEWESRKWDKRKGVKVERVGVRARERGLVCGAREMLRVE